MTRRTASLLALMPPGAALPIAAGQALPTDMAELNKFAALYNDYIKQLDHGLQDLKAWACARTRELVQLARQLDEFPKEPMVEPTQLEQWGVTHDVAMNDIRFRITELSETVKRLVDGGFDAMAGHWARSLVHIARQLDEFPKEPTP